MFKTTTATVNNSESNSLYMPVGIIDNVTLKEVNVNKTPNGRDFLEIIFEDSEGKTTSMTEWKNEKNMWIKTDEDLQNRDNRQFGRILQIIQCYIEQVPEVELASFVDMINWVKATLTPYIATKKALRLKNIYNKKGFTVVSQYGIFVEPMTVAKDDSQIKLFKNDLLERPIVADKENNDPFAGATASTSDSTNIASGDSDLPF